MFGALKGGHFRSLASLILVVNVVGKLQQKRTLAASRGFLAAARLSCLKLAMVKPMSSSVDEVDTQNSSLGSVNSGASERTAELTDLMAETEHHFQH